MDTEQARDADRSHGQAGAISLESFSMTECRLDAMTIDDVAVTDRLAAYRAARPVKRASVR